MSEADAGARGGEGSPEELEGGKLESAEQRGLDEATSEPEAHVEQMGDYQESEAIEAAMTELIDESLATEVDEVSATPLPIPHVAEEADPDLEVDEQVTVGEVSASPLPIPHVADEPDVELKGAEGEQTDEANLSEGMDEDEAPEGQEVEGE